MIKEIRGLDALTKLEVLSLGDNELESFEAAQLLYLRPFKTLRGLSLAGNPL